MTIRELKKILKDSTKDELLLLIIDLLKVCPQAKDFLTIKFSSQDNIKKVFEEYKKTLLNSFYPDNEYGELNLRQAKKTISDFTKISTDKVMIIDIMLFFVELCVKVTADYLELDREIFISTETMFQNVVLMINESEQEIFEQFSNRLKWVIDKAVEGWGFQDTLLEIYNDIRFLEI
ncbi:MAG: DUF6155 family protein [Candidatus Cloacimonetes bacterium]|nr:DUF6155 family protein [Candidatus Cloacimonadota bacterium]